MQWRDQRRRGLKTELLVGPPGRQNLPLNHLMGDGIEIDVGKGMRADFVIQLRRTDLVDQIRCVKQWVCLDVSGRTDIEVTRERTVVIAITGVQQQVADDVEGDGDRVGITEVEQPTQALGFLSSPVANLLEGV